MTWWLINGRCCAALVRCNFTCRHFRKPVQEGSNCGIDLQQRYTNLETSLGSFAPYCRASSVWSKFSMELWFADTPNSQYLV